MSIQGFASSLIFGALLAISFVFSAVALGPFLGHDSTLALHLGGGLIAYAAALAPSGRKALRNALVAALGGAAVLLATSAPGGLALGATMVLAAIRTGLSTGGGSPRSWLAEGVLGVAALVFAGSIGFAGPIGQATAIWGYALVQSLYFLVPGPRLRRTRSQEDPFEKACGRLVLLLDED
jgi:hypothetical protein